MIITKSLVGKSIFCAYCKKETDIAIEIHGYSKEDTWLCRGCAQHLMRILLEDIIAYDNGSHVSLLGVMYHEGQRGEKQSQYERWKTRDPLKGMP